MFRKLLLTTALLTAAVSVAGCLARVPFTDNLRSQYTLQEAEIRNLQFFISHNVLLERRMTEADTVVNQNHKLVVRSGQKIEQIVIMVGTPGVVEKVEGDSISVSFEKGSNLLFKASAAAGGRYRLVCPGEAPGCQAELHTANGPVPFKAVGESYRAHLTIDKAHVDQYQQRVKVQGGRRL